MIKKGITMEEKNYMSAYTSVIEENPILSRKEELDLLKTMANKSKNKSKIAREKLFNSNLKLVIKQANHYHYFSKSSISLEDLVEAGIEGLAIAIDRFDVSSGNKLSTYAIPWINLKIFQLMKTFSSPVYIPDNIIEKSNHYKKINRDSNKVTDKSLMKELNVSEKCLSKIRLSQFNTISLDDDSAINHKDGSSSIREIIPDNNVKPVDSNLQENDRKIIIATALSKLTPIQRDILTERYLGVDKQNLKSISQKHGITCERVRQIEAKALRRLRMRMKELTSLQY